MYFVIFYKKEDSRNRRKQNPPRSHFGHFYFCPKSIIGVYFFHKKIVETDMQSIPFFVFQFDCITKKISDPKRHDFCAKSARKAQNYGGNGTKNATNSCRLIYEGHSPCFTQTITLPLILVLVYIKYFIHKNNIKNTPHYMLYPLCVSHYRLVDTKHR